MNNNTSFKAFVLAVRKGTYEMFNVQTIAVSNMYVVLKHEGKELHFKPDSGDGILFNYQGCWLPYTLTEVINNLEYKFNSKMREFVYQAQNVFLDIEVFRKGNKQMFYASHNGKRATISYNYKTKEFKSGKLSATSLIGLYYKVFPELKIRRK